MLFLPCSLPTLHPPPTLYCILYHNAHTGSPHSLVASSFFSPSFATLTHASAQPLNTKLRPKVNSLRVTNFYPAHTLSRREKRRYSTPLYSTTCLPFLRRKWGESTSRREGRLSWWKTREEAIQPASMSRERGVAIREGFFSKSFLCFCCCTAGKMKLGDRRGGGGYKDENHPLILLLDLFDTTVAGFSILFSHPLFRFLGVQKKAC